MNHKAPAAAGNDDPELFVCRTRLAGTDWTR